MKKMSFAAPTVVIALLIFSSVALFSVEANESPCGSEVNRFSLALNEWKTCMNVHSKNCGCLNKYYAVNITSLNSTCAGATSSDKDVYQNALSEYNKNKKVGEENVYYCKYCYEPFGLLKTVKCTANSCSCPQPYTDVYQASIKFMTCPDKNIPELQSVYNITGSISKMALRYKAEKLDYKCSSCSKDVLDSFISQYGHSLTQKCNYSHSIYIFFPEVLDICDAKCGFNDTVAKYNQLDSLHGCKSASNPLTQRAYNSIRTISMVNLYLKMCATACGMEWWTYYRNSLDLKSCISNNSETFCVSCSEKASAYTSSKSKCDAVKEECKEVVNYLDQADRGISLRHIVNMNDIDLDRCKSNSDGSSGSPGFTGKPLDSAGYSGYSGNSGYSSYSGYSGNSGYSGYSGNSGYSSNSGYSGNSGYSSDSGGRYVSSGNSLFSACLSFCVLVLLGLFVSLM